MSFYRIFRRGARSNLGLFDIFKKNDNKDYNYARMLNGYAPIFSQFGQDIYASDVIQQAINCIVQEMKKLQPQHIRKGNNDKDTISVDDSIVQRILDYPNPLMTTSEFLEKIIWQLFFNYNSFIIPTYDLIRNSDGTKTKRYTGLYPVQPIRVNFIEDKSKTLFAELEFLNNFKTTILYDDVIHIRYKYSVNEYMGGNQFGQPDHESLLKTLELNNTLLQGVSNAMKSSFAINGIIKYNSLLDKDKMENAIKELEDHLKNNNSGFLPLDLKGEFIPFKREIELVDEATLKFIDSKILRHFGVSLPILTGDYTPQQFEAFHNKTLEPLMVSISQAFTKTLFTDRERGFGNKIALYSKELLFMTSAEKIKLVEILSPQGGLYINEIRTIFGMTPDKDSEGKKMMSLNWINVDDATQYQLEQSKLNKKESNNG